MSDTIMYHEGSLRDLTAGNGHSTAHIAGVFR
jgi:hypothetical protein